MKRTATHLALFRMIAIAGWLGAIPLQGETTIGQIVCETESLEGGVSVGIQNRHGIDDDGEIEGNSFDAGLNSHGDVVTVLDIGSDGDQAVVLRRLGQSPEVLVKSGDRFSLGEQDGAIDAIRKAMVGANGRVMVHAYSEGRLMVLLGGDSAMSLLAYNGQSISLPADELPGVNQADIKRSTLLIGDASLDASGNVVLFGSIQTFTEDNRDFHTSHLWRGSLTEATREKLSGAAIEGSIHTFDSIHEIHAHNAEGDLLLDAFIGEGGQGGEALLHFRDGIFHSLIERGKTLPDGLGEVRVHQHERLAPRGGWAVFQVDFSDETDARGLYASRGGEIIPVAIEGAVVPSRPGFRWGTVEDPTIQPDGSVVFTGLIINGPEIQADLSNLELGFWRWQEGVVTPLAIGAQLIGERDVSNLESLFGVATELPITVLPGGEVLYAVRTDLLDFDSPTEVWMLDSQGKAQPLIRQGAKYGTQTIKSSWMNHDRDFRGLTRDTAAVAEQGQVLVDLRLTNNRHCLALVEPGIETGAEVTLHRFGQEALDDFNIASPSSHMDDPLVPLSEVTLLEKQPMISGGLVADGVTPLLLRIEFPEEMVERAESYRLEGRVTGGSLARDPLNTSRLKTLRHGEWGVSGFIDVNPESRIGYAYLVPIKPEHVLLADGSNELTFQLTVFFENNTESENTHSFKVRKPPIFLIPDTPSAGWGADFLNELYKTRPPDFVRHLSDWRPEDLKDLNLTRGVTKAEVLQWKDHYEKLSKTWAFTRPDVIAHGSGGILAKLLDDAWMEDLARGQFRAAVTIGTNQQTYPPIISWYLRILTERLSSLEKTRSILSFIPETITRTPSWNPTHIELVGIGVIAKNLGNPYARIHSIGTTLSVFKEGVETIPDPFLFTGIVGDRLKLLAPFGSDGIVGLDETLANLPSQAVSMVSGDYSHDPSFGRVGQTHAQAVASRAIAALDGGLDRFLEKKQIDDLAAPVSRYSQALQEALETAIGNTLIDFLDAVLVARLPQLQAIQEQNEGDEAGCRSFTFALEPSSDFPLLSSPAWIAEIYGAQGVTTEGIIVVADPGDIHKVEVRVDDAVRGDVVLFASYGTPDGGVLFAQPQRVVAVEQDSSIASISMQPNGLALGVGEIVIPELSSHHADGTKARRWLTEDAFTATSSNPSVIDVSAPLRWRMLAPGTATISAGYLGHSTTVTLTVISDELTYDDWKSANFGPAEFDDPQVAGPAADPDHDSVPNALEYILIGNPWQNDVSDLVVAGLTQIEDVFYPTLTFERREGVIQADLLVQTSEDLRSWQTLYGFGDDLDRESPLIVVQDGNRFTIRDRSPLGASRYFRLVGEIVSPELR